MDEEVSKKAKEILNKYKTLKTIRKDWEPLWEECEFSVAPISKKWDDEKPRDTYQLPERETSFATNCLNTCCTGLAGYAISPSIKWFKLELDNPELQEEDGVPQWLEACEKILLNTFMDAELYKKAIQWIKLACIYGHSAMLIEEITGGDVNVRYKVVENHELYLDLNDIGQVDKAYRYYWTDCENIVNRYGKKAMAKKFVEKYEKWEERRDNGDAVEPIDIKILHAVEIRRVGKSDKTETVENKKWASYIIDIENKHIIKESGYDEFPYAIFYWESDGKPYGISPTIAGMRDIQFYQQFYSAYNIVVQNIADPPYALPPGVSAWDFSPGGITRVHDAQQMPQQITRENSVALLQEKPAFEQRIKEWYFVDFFIMLRQREGLGQMTATAVAAMQGEQVALLSSIVSNFYKELDRIVERTFNILAKKQKFPPMPYALQQIGGALKVRHKGVLAQAQKKLYECGGVEELLGILGQFTNLGEIEPEYGKALGWINPKKAFKGVAEARDIPSSFLRTQEEYDNWIAGIDEKEQALAKQQAESSENQALLQNAKNLNQKPVEGSLLDNWLKPKADTMLPGKNR